jgi:hypothetical protein
LVLAGGLLLHRRHPLWWIPHALLLAPAFFSLFARLLR